MSPLFGRPGAHIDTIQEQRALRLTGLKEFNVQIDATDDPKSIQECDILIYTVKAQDTEAVLTTTKHIQVHEGVISLQNGVVKDELLINVFGKEKVIGGLAVVAGGASSAGNRELDVRWRHTVWRTRGRHIGTCRRDCGAF